MKLQGNILTVSRHLSESIDTGVVCIGYANTVMWFPGCAPVTATRYRIDINQLRELK